MNKFTIEQNEWVKVAETLFFVALAAIVDYLASHLNLLPFSPVWIAILTPVLQTVKYSVDGLIK